MSSRRYRQRQYRAIRPRRLPSFRQPVRWGQRSLWRAVHDGIIYRLLATPSFVGVEAVDSATGSIVWKQSHDWSRFGLLADESHVYFERGPSEVGRVSIVALKASTGEEAWMRELAGFSMGMSLQDGILFVEHNRNRLTAIRNGAVLWEQPIDSADIASQPINGKVYARSAPVGNENAVVAMSESGVISAFDIHFGDRLWASDKACSSETLVIVAREMLVVLGPPDPSASAGGMAVANAIGGDATNGDMAPGAAIVHFGAPVAVGSGSSSSSASGSGRDGGMVPTVSSSTASSNHHWAATGLSLADGSVDWKSDICGPVWQSTVIEDTVAFVSVPGKLDGSPAALPHKQ